MKTSDLIGVFNDTQECIENDPFLKQRNDEACRRTVVYEEGFVSSKKTVKSQNYGVVVTESTSLKCAQQFSNGIDKVAVLNFANPFEPGGGVCRGARAQEESLCRCSTL